MEDADKELKEIETMLRALAAEDRAGHPQDAAMLARLTDKADAVCSRSTLRPWYRSPILWRSAAALVLLAMVPVLWQGLQEPVSRGPLVHTSPVAQAVVPQLEPVTVCGTGEGESEALVISMPESVSALMSGATVASVAAVAESRPDNLPTLSPAAVAVVDNAGTVEMVTHETAVAVYSGGAEAECEAEDAEESAWVLPNAAMAQNIAPDAERCMPSANMRSAAHPLMKAARGKGKARNAPAVRSVADKLKTYAAALRRAVDLP
ncbi:MAG: hypothetical protein IKV92_08495 [Akkermansia sp.]|nr:hypothetical protein [Akkermansia sp.]